MISPSAPPSISIPPCMQRCVHANRSVSELVNDAVRASLVEDQEDLAAFEMRVAEPTISYKALLVDLKANDKL